MSRDKTTVTAVMAQFGPELFFQGVESNSVDEEPLHSFTQLWFGPGNHGRSGEESWELRGALRAHALFGAFLHMIHHQHNSKACESTKAEPSPRGTPKFLRDELRKQPGWLEMPHPCVSPGQELLGALQNSIQHPPEPPSAHSAAPEVLGGE